MKFSESQLSPEMRDAIDDYAAEAARILGLDAPETMSPDEIVEAVDQCVCQLQKGAGPKFAEDEEAALLLGCLWGQQLVRQLRWQWVGVTFHEFDNAEATGVVSANRSLAIYPFHFIFECLENQAPVTIRLAFDILKEGRRVPSLPARGYENVMDHVRHEPPRE
ncbi:MAG: hypothetical protein ACTHK7_01825 [Aureliella sp.]